MSELLVDPKVFVGAAETRLGCWYVFARRGPDVFDCSGLVGWALMKAGGPDLRFTYSSQTYWDNFEELDRPAEGEVCLAFYGFPSTPAVVHHVMIVVGDGRVLGASGGDHTTRSIPMAKLRGAKVQFKPKVEYRPDFLGYRRLALKEPPHGRATT